MKPSDSTKDPNDGSVMVANAAVARWESLVNALTPVLGQRGVAALYRRNLSIAGRAHPCLTEAMEEGEPVNFNNLRNTLIQQPPADAAAATDTSIETFHELLNNLIGISLTQKLLGTVWSPIFSGSPVKDKST